MKAGPAQIRANESNLELFMYLKPIMLPGTLECPDLFGISLVRKEVLGPFLYPPATSARNITPRLARQLKKLLSAVILEIDFFRQSHSV